MKKLLALDLDGTLLRSDGTLSERSRTALQTAHERGWIVFPVTARPSRAALPLAQAEGWPEVGCSNGAITLRSTGEVIERHPLPLPDLTEYIRQARKRVPGVTFGTEWGTHMACEGEYRRLRSQGNPLDDDAVNVAQDVMSALDSHILKLMVRHPTLTALQLAEQLDSGVLEVTYSTPSFLEVSHPDANKFWCVKTASEWHAVTWENVIAFGDSRADLPMIAAAVHSVAVANAQPDVLTAATEITLSNDEDGVAVVIERLL